MARDTSRAKWPERMIVEGPVRNANPDPNGPNICTAFIGGIFIHGFDFDEVEAKADQIATLPRMVALLKEADANEHMINANWFARLRDILRDIGEVD